MTKLMLILALAMSGTVALAADQQPECDANCQIVLNTLNDQKDSSNLLYQTAMNAPYLAVRLAALDDINALTSSWNQSTQTYAVRNLIRLASETDSSTVKLKAIQLLTHLESVWNLQCQMTVIGGIRDIALGSSDAKVSLAALEALSSSFWNRGAEQERIEAKSEITQHSQQGYYTPAR